jgi:hypothetical protein
MDKTEEEDGRRGAQLWRRQQMAVIGVLALYT